MRRYNCPQKGHITQKIKENIKMVEIFEKCVGKYKKQPFEWIKQQFKWSWMHLLLNPVCNQNFLEEEIMGIMQWRYENENSILRKIVEFDDIPYRYCVLGILWVEKTYVVVFDGFYSLKIKIDPDLYEKLKNLSLGDKIHVFGMELLIEKPISIFEAGNEMLLKLNFNGTQICMKNTALGYRKRIAFLNSIGEIRMDGGVISGLIFRIEKIIETKYLVVAGNYRKKVDDYEEEIENIVEMAEKAGRILKKEEVSIKKYCTVKITDESAECLLTWWNPPEIKKDEKYKMVYLNPSKRSIGLKLNTSKKTYYEKSNN
ncbi:hypothetical protein NUSPORA_01666 [Nucleospora cyclopteri]